MSGSTVGFAGLSHLGIIYSMAAAARGFSVVAFDERHGLAENLSAGQFPITEPGLHDAFRDHGTNIQYSADPASLAVCPLIFLTLDVQTDDAGVSNLVPLETLIDLVAANAAPGTVLVLMSQVPPGYCRKLAQRLPATVQLFYLVETLVFGNAVERAIRPERYMVGCNDVADGLPEVYRGYLDAFECPVLSMRYESAELCKIAINCFLVSSVSTSNTLAEICENIGADWSEIVPALRLDRRIGPHAYLSPGLGIAGGNLERDLVTVGALASLYGTDSRVVEAWRQNSSYRKDWVLRALGRKGFLARGSAIRLAIWGITYKPDTHSIKNSPSVALIQALGGYRLSVHDPAVTLGEKEFPHVRNCGSPLEAVHDADVLVIMTPWKQFSEVSPADVRSGMRGHHVMDPFAVLDESACRHAGLEYRRLGA